MTVLVAFHWNFFSCPCLRQLSVQTGKIFQKRFQFNTTTTNQLIDVISNHYQQNANTEQTLHRQNVRTDHWTTENSCFQKMYCQTFLHALVGILCNLQSQWNEYVRVTITDCENGVKNKKEHCQIKVYN